ncbi:MAG: hypothetical protein R2724_24090 [Bryobacterales bacterium]
MSRSCLCRTASSKAAQTTGEAYKPLLDGLEEGRLMRSKLSWEGGDLQFIRDPSDPARLILFHGSAARSYWGKDLDDAEYAYVLRTEFGADASIDLSGLSAHVDYVVALLPLDKTVLLTKPIRGDADLARAAAAMLQQAWGKGGAELAAALQLACKLETASRKQPHPRDARAHAARFSQLEDDIDDALAADLDAYTRRYCPGSEDCFEGAGRAAMFERDPALLKRALDGVSAMLARAELTPKLLGVIEAQLRREPWPRELLLDRKAREIQALGFRVVRTPRIAGENAGAWPGVAYVNALAWGRRIFLPTLGLGQYEQTLFDELAAQLPSYELVPTPARDALLRNGGVHCVFGLVRAKPQ